MTFYGYEYRCGRKATWWERMKRHFWQWAERWFA